MSTLLAQWKMNSLTARNGEEAAAALAVSRWPVDVILADYHLEQDDGLVVIEQLRAQAARAVPAVLITADRSRAIQDDAAAKGVAYMRKPVRPAALRATLSFLMTRVEAAE
jgi:CheY-like chemotaxis protein